MVQGGLLGLQANNLKAAYMHLTNYAVNKHNENFVSGGEEDSSKWDFTMLRYLRTAVNAALYSLYITAMLRNNSIRVQMLGKGLSHLVCAHNCF